MGWISLISAIVLWFGWAASARAGNYFPTTEDRILATITDRNAIGLNVGHQQGRIEFVHGQQADTLFPVSDRVLRVRYSFDGFRFVEGYSGVGILADYQGIDFKSDAGSSFVGSILSTVAMGHIQYRLWDVQGFLGIGYGLSNVNAVAEICFADHCDNLERQRFNISAFIFSYHFNGEVAFEKFFPENFRLGFQNILIIGKDNPGIYVQRESDYIYLLDLRILYLALQSSF